MHLFCTLHPGPLLVREQDVPVEPGGVRVGFATQVAHVVGGGLKKRKNINCNKYEQIRFINFV